MEIHTNIRIFSLQSQTANIENQKFTIICITLFLFPVGICFALFQTRILCQRTIVFIAPIKTDHCVHIQWMSSQGHHRNGFQPGTRHIQNFRLRILFHHLVCNQDPAAQSTGISTVPHFDNLPLNINFLLPAYTDLSSSFPLFP